MSAANRKESRIMKSMFEISEGRPDVTGKGEPIIEFNNVTSAFYQIKEI